MGPPLAIIQRIHSEQHVHGPFYGYVALFNRQFETGILIGSDEMLFAFMVPLLPYILERRIGLDKTVTQRFTSVFLIEGALVSIVSSPFIGDVADRVRSKKVLLLVLLAFTLISVLCLSVTNSRTWSGPVPSPQNKY